MMVLLFALSCVFEMCVWELFAYYTREVLAKFDAFNIESSVRATAITEATATAHQKLGHCVICADSP